MGVELKTEPIPRIPHRVISHHPRIEVPVQPTRESLMDDDCGWGAGRKRERRTVGVDADVESGDGERGGTASGGEGDGEGGDGVG